MIQVMGVFTDGQLAQTGSDESHPFGHIPGDPDLADRIQLLAKEVSAVDKAFIWIALFEPTKPEMSFVADLFELAAVTS
ncbi:MAG: hypothetical protein V9E85_01450 [Candidatus Nanopelagicales bacterium]